MEQFNLAVIGAGSGNVVVSDDRNLGGVALIESGAFGGTCLNRGCIPTKMFVYTADLATDVLEAPTFGVAATIDKVDWPAIRDRIMGRVDESSSAHRDELVASPDLAVFEGRARFTGPHQLSIDGATSIEAEQIVIATGGRPSVPPVVTASGVPFHTSDTIMRLDDLPASMVILGGGYVAVEFAHVFSSLGVGVHVVEMASSLLSALDSEISKRFTALAAARWDVHLDATVSEVVGDADGIEFDPGRRPPGGWRAPAGGDRSPAEHRRSRSGASGGLGPS